MNGEALAFVVMPFDPEFDVVYEKLIAPTLRDAGYKVARADKTLDQRNILKNIIPNIYRADLIVADLTTLNANVFYELGVAHALQKAVVMMTQDLEELPFDLRSYTIIDYSDRIGEVDKFTTRLREIAVAHREGKVVFENPVTDFVPELPMASAKGVFEEERPEEERERAPAAEERPEEGEAGLVDLMVEAEEAAAEYGAAMDEFTERTNALVESQAKHVEALKSIDRTAPGAASRIQAVLKSLGLEMVTYSEKVNSLLESRISSLERLIEVGQKQLAHPRVVAEENRDEFLKVRTTLSELQINLNKGQEAVEGGREALRQLGGYSRILDMGVRRTEHTLDRFKNSFLSAESRLSRLINLIDERLAGPDETK